MLLVVSLRGTAHVCLPQGQCLLRRPDQVEAVDLEAGLCPTGCPGPSWDPLPQAYALVGVHSAKATLLAWARQPNLPDSLRRIQGHDKLVGSESSVHLYGRDDIGPMLLLQRDIRRHILSGFRPLQPWLAVTQPRLLTLKWTFLPLSWPRWIRPLCLRWMRQSLTYPTGTCSLPQHARLRGTRLLCTRRPRRPLLHLGLTQMRPISLSRGCSQTQRLLRWSWWQFASRAALGGIWLEILPVARSGYLTTGPPCSMPQLQFRLALTDRCPFSWITNLFRCALHVALQFIS